MKQTSIIDKRLPIIAAAAFTAAARQTYQVLFPRPPVKHDGVPGSSLCTAKEVVPQGEAPDTRGLEPVLIFCEEQNIASLYNTPLYLSFSNTGSSQVFQNSARAPHLTVTRGGEGVRLVAAFVAFYRLQVWVRKDREGGPLQGKRAGRCVVKPLNGCNGGVVLKRPILAEMFK
ncbi:hypothetical protein E2C01_035446 [Portunus trituberculatus]|uniref:Uncharacterized protein n=1 Tax=Portunus trituberculatus TaxID=210409 RepID=A0A5B7F9C7_PORTR|nr:hypothetical protein [Portunus trituberculatus]